MIDFHTHILPNIDDGASSTKMSNDMVSELKKQGVKNIVLTPHFYSHNTSLDTFVKKRKESYNNLLLSNSANDLILGSETYFSKYIFKYKDISELLIGNSNYILFEIPFQNFSPKEIEEHIYRFMTAYNVTPILAHIERYPYLLNNNVLRSIKHMGCLLQVNLSSVNKGFFKKRQLLKLIDSGIIDLLGTDCHNLTSRPPIYKKYIEMISKSIGYDAINEINHLGEQIISSC